MYIRNKTTKSKVLEKFDSRKPNFLIKILTDKTNSAEFSLAEKRTNCIYKIRLAEKCAIIFFINWFIFC